MDAIKKKMQAMKIDKENALDKSEQLEQKLRDTEEEKAKVSFSNNFKLAKWSFLGIFLMKQRVTSGNFRFNIVLSKIWLLKRFEATSA